MSWRVDITYFDKTVDSLTSNSEPRLEVDGDEDGALMRITCFDVKGNIKRRWVAPIKALFNVQMESLEGAS